MDDETRDEEYRVTLRMVPGGEREYGTVGLLREGPEPDELLRREHREVSLAAWQRRLRAREERLAEREDALIGWTGALRGWTLGLGAVLLLLLLGIGVLLLLADAVLPR
jgi:hypothetical protein